MQKRADVQTAVEEGGRLLCVKLATYRPVVCVRVLGIIEFGRFIGGADVRPSIVAVSTN